MGATEEDIEQLRTWLNANNPAWLQFAGWVVNDFLPSNRARYNEVYRAMNGTDMDFAENYFPHSSYVYDTQGGRPRRPLIRE